METCALFPIFSVFAALLEIISRGAAKDAKKNRENPTDAKKFLVPANVVVLSL